MDRLTKFSSSAVTPDNESVDGPGYAAGEAAYDPITNRWRRLPTMPSTAGHDVRHLRAMATDRGIYVGQMWQHITTDGDTTTLDAGVDFVVYDAVHNTWTKYATSAHTLDDQAPGLDGVTVAGGRALGTARSGLAQRRIDAAARV